jgi:hypothetical protein
MDATVTNAVVTVRKPGNIPESLIQFFDKVKPEVQHDVSARVAFLRFKTDKETKTKRENMAVLVPKFDPDNFGAKTDHEFVQDLICNHHDSLLVRCANGEISWADATSQEFMVKDYFDNSRDSSGRLVTKESIAAWFNSTVASTVEVRAKMKNAQMTAETVARVVAGYREMFQKFTKYDLVNAFTEPQLVLLTTLMTETTFAEDDAIAEYVLTKISKIGEQKKVQDELIDAI